MLSMCACTGMGIPHVEQVPVRFFASRAFCSGAPLPRAVQCRALMGARTIGHGRQQKRPFPSSLLLAACSPCTLPPCTTPCTLHPCTQ